MVRLKRCSFGLHGYYLPVALTEPSACIRSALGRRCCLVPDPCHSNFPRTVFKTGLRTPKRPLTVASVAYGPQVPLQFLCDRKFRCDHHGRCLLDVVSWPCPFASFIARRVRVSAAGNIADAAATPRRGRDRIAFERPRNGF